MKPVILGVFLLFSLNALAKNVCRNQALWVYDQPDNSTNPTPWSDLHELAQRGVQITPKMLNFALPGVCYLNISGIKNPSPNALMWTRSVAVKLYERAVVLFNPNSAPFTFKSNGAWPINDRACNYYKQKLKNSLSKWLNFGTHTHNGDTFQFISPASPAVYNYKIYLSREGEDRDGIIIKINDDQICKYPLAR